jgi:hypothetical protein
MTIEQKLRKPVDPQVTKKGFIGREGLASSFHELTTENSADEKKILSAHIVKETVMAIVRAIKTKNAFEDHIIKEAQMIMQERNAVIEPEARKSNHDLSSVEGVVCAALDGMGIDAEVSLQKRGSGNSGTYSIFIVKTSTGSDKVMMKESVMSEEQPVSSAQNALKLQGIGIDKSTPRSEPSNRRASDIVELKREDFQRRKIGFHGNHDGGLNHFTYLEVGMESTFCIRPDLMGDQLLQFIDKRIVHFHVSYNRRLSSQVAEVFSENNEASSGIEMIADERLRKTSKTIFMLANSFNDELVPEEYQGAVKRLKESPEFYSFLANETDGAISQEELGEFRMAFEMVDHTAHKMARKIVHGFTEGKRELTDDEKVILRETIMQNSKGPAGVPPKVLEVLAEAYSMVSNEDVSSWDDAKKEKNYLKMAYHIRKAVIGLGACLKVISNDEAKAESFEI